MNFFFNRGANNSGSIIQQSIFSSSLFYFHLAIYHLFLSSLHPSTNKSNTLSVLPGWISTWASTHPSIPVIQPSIFFFFHPIRFSPHPSTYLIIIILTSSTSLLPSIQFVLAFFFYSMAPSRPVNITLFSFHPHIPSIHPFSSVHPNE